QMEEDQRALSEKNVTLREVLSQIENEKKEIQEQIQANVNKVLLPMLINFKNHLSKEGQEYLQLFRKNLQDITSPFVNKLDMLYSKLTPREIEVCNMIKNGMLSKDIATTLRVSIETIHKTRYNIRKKLNILHEDINLTSFLKTL
ncbi:MAG: helix-turn-helix transcriptional regulator, partial [candidate division Zixibacteria bacterium]|nr:helix-turn-helix transcriptional regulator [candidate division Zixibacteria bacterium]